MLANSMSRMNVVTIRLLFGTWKCLFENITSPLAPLVQVTIKEFSPPYESSTNNFESNKAP